MHLTLVARELKLPAKVKLIARLNLANSDKVDRFYSAMTSGSDFVSLKTSDRTEMSAIKTIISEKSAVFKRMFEISSKISEFSGKVMSELLRFISIGNVHEAAKT